MLTLFLVVWIISTIVGRHAYSEPLWRSTAQHDAPTVRFYDGRGNVTGSASTYGNTTRFYDAHGNAVGTATTNTKK
jgi:YD repeat-containing protein